jgi:hypothetical protein
MFKLVGQNIRSLLKFFEIFDEYECDKKNCTFSHQFLGQLP